MKEYRFEDLIKTSNGRIIIARSMIEPLRGWGRKDRLESSLKPCIKCGRVEECYLGEEVGDGINCWCEIGCLKVD